jgi:hypothetical protein
MRSFGQMDSGDDGLGKVSRAGRQVSDRIEGR